MSTTPTQKIRDRLEAARKALPDIKAKIAKLPHESKTLFQSIAESFAGVPESVRSYQDVQIVEKIQTFLSKQPAPVAKVEAKPEPKPTLGQQALAAVLNPKTAGPALTGLQRAIAAHKAEAAAKKGGTQATKPAPAPAPVAAAQPVKPPQATTMPDLSALHGLERAKAAAEFGRHGKLSERTERLISLRKSQH